MSLDTFNVTRPGLPFGGTDPHGLMIEQYTGIVEGTIARESKLAKWIPMRTLKGTSTAQSYGVSGAELQAIVPGQTPDGTGTDFNKATVTVDTHILARNYLPELDVFQTEYDARAEIGREQGEIMARFMDQAFLIQAAKAAALTVSPYGAMDSFKGGSTATLTGDATDPAVVEAALLNLYKQMAQKDVNVSAGNFLAVVDADIFFALLESERIINANYITSKGTKVENGWVLKSFGVPVEHSENLPKGVVSGHKLSNARNSNAYDGDFTGLKGVILSPRALMAASTIPVRSDVFFDKVSKSWIVDTDTAFGIAANRAEFAGRIVE